MFAIGHFGLGYLLGKLFAKIANVKVDIGLLFTASVFPDLDILFLQFIKHRGPFHSILFSLIIFLPLFVKFKRKSIPYFVALLSHALIGDIFGGGVELLWPFSTNMFYVLNISVTNTLSIALELALFIGAVAIMTVNKDLKKTLYGKTNWLYYIIPTGAILGPLLLTIQNYNNLPNLLLIPSLFCLGLFFFASLFSLLPALKSISTSKN